MGSSVLKGITTALLVTVLTLFAGIAWGATGLGGLSVSKLVDIGLLVSCLIGGYRAGKESGQFVLGGVTGAGYVIVGTILLALFLPIQGWGFLQILAEGSIIGLIAGAMGMGGSNVGILGSNYGRSQSRFTPTHYSQSYGNYETDFGNTDSSDWGIVEQVSERKKQPEIDWCDRSEFEPRKSYGINNFTNESEKAVWNCDREEEKMISSRPNKYEPLAIWEPERVLENDIKWNSPDMENTRSLTSPARIENLSLGKMNDLKPWWEN